jgi:hypothetical protein
MEQTQIEEIENLLKNVGEKVDKANEIARLKGENFNIFSILGVETKENKTHSNFLVSLLNPEGSHGMGSAFLNLFYDELKSVVSVKDEDKITDEDKNKSNILEELRGDKVIVRAEEGLGKVNLEDATGGRVDITLRSLKGNGNIFIENKIHAGDQHLQIARYCKNHIKEKNIVLYLTLDGSQPSDNSRGNNKEGKDFFLLSYQTNIINWLEECQKEASDFPIIRETIKQYIILIKKLTGQLTSQEMENEIVNLIKNDLKNAFIVANNIEKAKKELILELFSRIKQILSNKLNNEWLISYSDDLSIKWSAGFYLKKKDWEDLNIAWVGNPYILTSENVLGVKVNIKQPIREKISNRFKDTNFFNKYKRNTDGWLGFRKLWITNDVLINISSEEGLSDMSSEIAEEFERLALLVDDCCNR